MISLYRHMFYIRERKQSLMWSVFVQLQQGRTSSYQQPRIQPSWTARQRSSTMSTWVWMSASLSSRGGRPRDSHRKILHRYCGERPCLVWEGGTFHGCEVHVSCVRTVVIGTRERWNCIIHIQSCCCCYPSIPAWFCFLGVFFFGQFPTPNWWRIFYKLCLCASQILPSLIWLWNTSVA